MTSTDKTVAPARPGPDLDRVLDALARLDGKARVIVDRAGRVLAGPVGVLARPGTWDEGRALRFHGGAATTMGAAARLLAVRGDDTEIAIIAPDPGSEPVLVRAAAVDEDHVCLVLAVPGRNGTMQLRELQALFGLTACEARIVMDLMEGCAPQTIAERRRNSIHTIRAHIRQCHRKIGVRTREELFSRILTLCT